MNGRQSAGRAGTSGASGPRFIVNGGSAGDGGRYDRYAETFDYEGEAREAFVQFRLATRSDNAWGELVATDGDAARPKRLCWFGNPPVPPAVPAPPAAPAPSQDGPRSGLARFVRLLGGHRR